MPHYSHGLGRVLYELTFALGLQVEAAKSETTADKTLPRIPK